MDQDVMEVCPGSGVHKIMKGVMWNQEGVAVVFGKGSWGIRECFGLDMGSCICCVRIGVQARNGRALRAIGERFLCDQEGLRL